MESTKTKQAAKAVAMGAFFPTVITFVPPEYTIYVFWLCVALASIGWAATQIDIPESDKTKWKVFYWALQILAANWGKALNAAVLLKGKK